MKFFQIATAFFLAGSNTAVGAYEVPSDILIAELADAYNTEVGTYLPLPKCTRMGAKLMECANKIKAEADEDKNIKKWVQSYDKAMKTSQRCVEKAMMGSPDKIVHCGAPLLDIVGKYCSTNAYRKACGTAPFMFEEFILDFTEKLEVAVWEDEDDMDFFGKAACVSEYEKARKCIEKTEAKAKKDADIKEWAKSLEKAKKAAEPCVTKARDSTAANLKCLSNAFKIANQYCSTKAFVKACKDASSSMFEEFASSSSSDGYGLRGSSFDKE